MKNYQIIAIVIVLLLTFSACREITVTTKINSDGSFTRSIIVSGDSADVFKKNLPYPIDDSWQQTYRIDTTGEKKHFLTYTKTYENADLLNSEIKTDTSWYNILGRRIEINKRFGFFYSYLTYREYFKHTNPYEQTKDYSYLTDEEYALLSRKTMPVPETDSIALEQLEDKVTKNLISIIRDEVIMEMESGIKLSNSPKLEAINLRTYKDSVDFKLDETEVEDFSKFIDFYAEWTGEESFYELKELAPPLFEEQTQRWLELMEVVLMEGYTQTVEMPGLITATNSTKLIGNKVSWKMEGFPVAFSDYEMYVESRVVNYWTFILTGLLLLLLILLLVAKAFKK